ncbi:DUF6927 domain-containing protein [Sagittula sp.]|uniref:DUF6927 domain-containing protein n=1 Tax=Sagittula sp. TaxID=2038081 RepID=UPI0040580B15
MGWLIYNHTPASIRDEIARLCTWTNEDGRGFPVLISRKGSVWYAAVRSEPATGRLDSGTDASGSFQTDATGGYTYAAVFLTRRENGGWGYKDMDETAGPVEAEAPAKLLDLLSRTRNAHALDWRQRCRSHAARTGRRLKAGDVIRFAEVLRFTDGSEGRTFRVNKERFAGANRASTFFTCIETGRDCRISRVMSRDWTRI